MDAPPSTRPESTTPGERAVGRRSGSVGGEGTRSRKASDGRHAPGWSPAATGQRTRAAWSSRPSPNPTAARRPASAEMLASREPTRYRYLTPIRDQEKFHERDAEAL